MWHANETPQPKCGKMVDNLFEFQSGTLEIPAGRDGNGKRKVIELPLDMFNHLSSLNLNELYNYAKKSIECKVKAQHVFQTKFGVIQLKSLADPKTGMYCFFQLCVFVVVFIHVSLLLLNFIVFALIQRLLFFITISVCLFYIGKYTIDVLEDFLQIFGKCPIVEINANLDCVDAKHRAQVLELIRRHATPKKLVFY